MAVAVILAVAHVIGAALVDHDHALEEEGLTAERRADVLGGEDVGRRAVGDQPPVQEGHQLEALGSRLHVVGAHEYGDAPLAQPREEAEDRLLGVHVHAGERLVEQQHVRLLGERPGEEHALLLAAGQLADGAPRELGDAELVQTARHHLAVGRLGAAQPAQAAVAPHHHHVAHGDGQAPVDLLAPGHVGDGIRLAAGRAAVQQHAPAAQGKQADPPGAAAYEANAAAYTKRLDELNAWIKSQVATVPAANRKLVMNHASHGYYADEYGFSVVGTVIPSVGTGETPTAQQLGDLTAAIRKSGAKAIFVEIEENPKLAEQIAAETGITVVDDLLDHSLTEPHGVAPTYIDMMKFDTKRIVEAMQ